jgi:hypothetical protein
VHDDLLGCIFAGFMVAGFILGAVLLVPLIRKRGAEHKRLRASLERIRWVCAEREGSSAEEDAKDAWTEARLALGGQTPNLKKTYSDLVLRK